MHGARSFASSPGPMNKEDPKNTPEGAVKKTDLPPTKPDSEPASFQEGEKTLPQDSQKNKDNLPHDAEKDKNIPTQDAQKEEESTGKPLDGMLKLSMSEEKAMGELIREMKKNIPKVQGRIMEEAFAFIKKNGIPKDMKDLLKELTYQGKPITVANALKLAKWTTQLTNFYTENVIKKHGNPGDQSQSRSQSSINFESSTHSEQGNKKSRNKNNNTFRVWEFKLDLTTLILSAFVSYLLFRSVVPGESSRNITYQEFQSTFLVKGLVEKLTVTNGGKVRVDLHREATQAQYPDSPAANPNFHYYFSIGSVESFERRLDEAQDQLGIPISERIPVNYASEADLWSLLINFGPTLLFISAIFYLSKRASSGAGGGSGVFGIGKTRAKRFNHETDVKVKFSDVAGMDEAKLEIMEFVSFLKTPETFERLGAKIPRGAILSGPPGTGKTLLAKATAGESQVPFFSVSGSEFVEMFVGVGASRVRDLFSEARKNTPCIIFIDEIDAIGKSRAKVGSFGGGNDEREATLNQILTEMDGFNTSEQVVVLAGTNRPDVLDKALLRPGRFDRHIAIDPPTMNGRKQIFLVHLKKIVTNEDLDYLTGRLSALTPGFSGADIANCCNEAALIGTLAFTNS